MIKLKDIAQELNLDVSVVSRALNPGRTPHPIREETRKLVLATAQRLGYHPNRQASFLKKGSGATILCFVPDVGHRVVADLVYGISEAAGEANFPVNFFFGKKEEDFFDFFKKIHSVPHAAVISYAPQLKIPEQGSHDLLPTLSDEYKKVILDYSRKHSSFLLLNLESNLNLCEDDEIQRINRIEIDEQVGGRRVAEHFLECGCERFFCVSGRQRYPLREKGFRDAATQYGIKCEALTCPLLAKLDKNGVKTGVFAESDFLAYDLIGLCKEMEIALGENILLAGYDDIFASAWLNPSLTTIHQPTRQEGHLAVKKVIDSLTASSQPSIERIEPTLIVRETTGGKRISDHLLNI
ncbi:MAG: LacI family transcriptional regulator [Lentisphaeria bacterium]|nr:LacI family transcriptional regulator [Lentisphaeria bacterium]